MDYTLPAPKFFISQLADTEIIQQAAVEDEEATSKWTHYKARGVTFQRVWLQGILIAGDDDLSEKIGALDDGSGVIELDMSRIPLSDMSLRAGAYIMVVGPLTVDRDDGGQYVKVHKLVDLSHAPNREAIWSLEVIEAENMRAKLEER